MRLKNATLWKFAGGGVFAGIVLTACGGGSSPSTIAIPPPNQTLQSMFGAGFAASFNRGRFDEPTDPVSGDVIAISLAADPLDVPDPT